MVSKVKAPELAQTKPKLGQGRAGLRCKKPKINQPITQLVKQPLKIPEDSYTQNTMTKAPNLQPQCNQKVIPVLETDRKIIQDTSKEIPLYPDWVYRHPS